MALVTLLAGGVALLLSALQPQEYSSQVQALIIQKQNFETDTYLAAKSAEKVGKNLTQVLGTSSFLDKVVQEGSVDISQIYNLPAQERHDAWAEKVVASVVADSGLLVITAYDENPRYAESLVLAVANVMTNSAGEYHGGGDSIIIRVVDAPVTSTYPVQPNIFVNVAVAMVLGVVLSVAYVFLRADVPFKKKILAAKQSVSSVVAEVSQPQVVLAEVEPVEPVVVEPTQPSYTILHPANLPQFETNVLMQSSEPVTMYDHLK